MNNEKPLPLENPTSFHPELVKVTGSINAALMLSVAISEDTKRINQHRYREHTFSFTSTEWEAVTGMSREQQVTARKRLVNLGIFEESLQGFPPRLVTSINWDVLIDLLPES